MQSARVWGKLAAVRKPEIPFFKARKAQSHCCLRGQAIKRAPRNPGPPSHLQG